MYIGARGNISTFPQSNMAIIPKINPIISHQILITFSVFSSHLYLLIANAILLEAEPTLRE